MIVDYYRNLRIDVNAVQADDRWNAEVRTLRLFSQDKPYVDTVTCLKDDARPGRAQRRNLGEAVG